MGLDNAGGSPTPAELAHMAAIVEEGVAAGAMGLCASRSANHRSAASGAVGVAEAVAAATGMTGDLAPGFYSTDEELYHISYVGVADVSEHIEFQVTLTLAIDI